jgi:hypothetical protein
MSLSYPSRIGDQVPASSEARDNLSKLLRVDPRGVKDQVATKVALQYFQRSIDLSPGYFDGLKSWAKANFVYVLAGTTATAAIGLAAYAASTTSYGRWIAGGLCGTAVVSYALGYRPEENIKALLTLAIRDTAVRAADSSIKNDQRIWQAKEKEAKECHKEILNQLSAVYNDCAKVGNNKLKKCKRAFGIEENCGPAGRAAPNDRKAIVRAWVRQTRNRGGLAKIQRRYPVRSRPGMQVIS